MDFLDPAKKRRHSLLLLIGYILMALIVVFGTLILVLYAYGFNIDRQSGEVIQNGLVFVDSAPDGATIKLNGRQRSETTNQRLVLLEGDYDVQLSKPGYQSWQRRFDLQGGQVIRFTYPLLVPQKLVSAELQSFDSAPSFGTQSPDHRWVFLAQPDTIDSFVQYDLENLTQKKPASAPLSLPAGLLSPSQDPQSWELVEWSSDNKHVLLKHMYGASQEFIMVNRDDPAQSLNINRELGQTPTAVSLHDKRFDRLYIYNQADKSLKTADLKTKVVNSVVGGVLSFKSHGGDVLLYSTVSPRDPAKARIFLRDGNQTYVLRDIPLSPHIPLAVTQFNGAWYAVIGSDSEHKSYVYKDPAAVLKRRSAQKPAPLAVLKSVGPIAALSFSDNARMIMVQSGQHFSVYDAEAKDTYDYELPDAIDSGTKPTWMDGHRLLVRSAGKVVVFDFDGINKHSLVAAASVGVPTFFDQDYTAMYNLSPSTATAGKQAFTRTELRVPAN